MANKSSEAVPTYDRLEKVSHKDGYLYWTCSGPDGKITGRFTAQMALYCLFRIGEIFWAGKTPVTPFPQSARARNREAH